MSLEEYISALKNYKRFKGDIVCHRTVEPARAVFASVLPEFKHDLSFVLKSLGVKQIYSHQKTAIEMILRGVHTVIATPTASGKSLVYNLPVIDQLIENPDAHALYLFPLKALARDQMDTIQNLLGAAGMKYPGAHLKAAVYDGDISSYQKSKIRKLPPHILLSNPEMLHLALLAHHKLWEDFFASLKFVVIDEVHTYRGVMGSNMAWVFRRLLRICRLYGASPVFIFCSATIANPASLCHKLTGLDVEVVDQAGAPTGKKDVILMRGLEGAAQTAITLIHSSVHRELRTICYTQSRKITELIAIWASRKAEEFSDRISAYRAGFLPEERRLIEQQLASGELLAVVSTSALELGIDIGSLDICILVGYPGTIMSTWQRAGRVGRHGRDSVMILIAHEDALDQYFINHPDVFFSMPPETAIINPDNTMILKQHLECAAAELALETSEPFLADSAVQNMVSSLEGDGRLLKSRDGRMWFAARKSPHREVSLRGTGQTFAIFIENTKKTLGEVDRHRSYFETHEGAVYLHRGLTYVITRFDHEKGVVEATQKQVNYYTRARSSKSTTIIKQMDSIMVKGTRVGFGMLKITEQVTGYDRKLVSSQKSIGVMPLDLPELEFETQGLWIEIPDTVRDEIEYERMHFMGGIHALEHAAIGIMPLLVMTDRNDLGGISIPFHPQTGKAAVFIYDGAPGGLGFCRQAFDNAAVFLERTFEVIDSCTCKSGCPCCVHSPKCGSGNRPIDKASAKKILELILEGKKPETFNTIYEKPQEPVTQDAVGQAQTVYLPEAGIDRPLHYGVLDIETRRSAQEVGGWHKADKMGVSCAILYDSKTDCYQEYLQEDMDQLISDLAQCDLIIGFNIIGFDYKVLSGLSDFDFYALPTLDMIIKVHEYLGYRLSLDHLAQQTLGEKKTADGLMALEWWAQGEMDKIISYCKQDVKVTRDLYLYGKTHRFLVFKNKAGQQVRVPVDW
ncbi:MAG: DEAD/DEAH box helicase [Proteobacteria bacterium]|nr:DEAD/DEAH box helicase [Pseudomonadota bacterium]MBU2431407.1 DEAD/DEAH box helicase [Pseudomonadota bacterium]MBU2482998.1 DEAD/DEAH box helicase [Pseudomonadota bacterium]